MTLNVIQWSTGGVGAIAIRTLQKRDDLELAGVWVHSEAKSGGDAGDLAGLAPIGLQATTDRAALLAARPSRFRVRRSTRVEHDRNRGRTA